MESAFYTDNNLGLFQDEFCILVFHSDPACLCLLFLTLSFCMISLTFFLFTLPTDNQKYWW